MKVVASWSGGKDSCFACYKALLQGYEVTHLVNFISKEYKRVSFHGTRAGLISSQAEAAGIPIAQYTVPPDLALYEQRFKKVISTLKCNGLEGMIFGDIYIQEQRDWVNRVCRELNIKPVLPLWGLSSEQVLTDFIRTGFKALVISANANFFSEEWLGRKLDQSFLTDIKALNQEQDIDIGGEQGEFHTFVVNGPLFQKRIDVTYGVKIQRKGYWLLDIPSSKLSKK